MKRSSKDVTVATLLRRADELRTEGALLMKSAVVLVAAMNEQAAELEAKAERMGPRAVA